MPRVDPRLIVAAGVIAGGAAVLAAAMIVGALSIGPSGVAAGIAAAAVVGVLLAVRPAVGVGAFLLAILFAQSAEQWFGGDLRLIDELSVVAIVLVSGARSWPVLRVRRPGWKEGALAVAIGAGIISSLVHAVPLQTWIPALALLVKAIAFFYAVSWLNLRLTDVEGLGAAIVGMAVVVLGLGIVEALDPVGFQEALRLPRFEEVRGGITVVKSIFLQPAIFGWFTVYASLLLYARFFFLRERWALAVALLLNVGTLLSARRRPLVGLVAALVTGVAAVDRPDALGDRSRCADTRHWARVWSSWPWLPPVALSDFWVATAEEYLSPGNLGEILQPNPDEDLIAPSHPRMVLYVASIAIARDDFPFGAGLGRFGSYMSEVDYSPVYYAYGLAKVYGLQPGHTVAVSDTYWPMILAELGPIGLAGVLVFFAAVVVSLWRWVRRSASPGGECRRPGWSAGPGRSAGRVDGGPNLRGTARRVLRAGGRRRRPGDGSDRYRHRGPGGASGGRDRLSRSEGTPLLRTPQGSEVPAPRRDSGNRHAE